MFAYSPNRVFLMLFIWLLSGGLPPTVADVYTYPVKSINLNSAMTPNFYITMDPSSDLFPATDFHPVHGIQTSDGSYVLTGKAVEADGSSIKEAFAIKLSPSGAYQWGWSSQISGDDAANAVIQLPGGSDLLVAGFRTLGGVASRSLTKLTLSGSETWTATFGDTSGSMGAWEMVSLGSNSIFLAGLQNKADGSEMLFKSYGNVVDGTAVIMKLPLSAVTSSTVPTASSATWTKTFSPYLTSKVARELSDGRVACLLFHETMQATVVMLDTDGTTAWGPTDYHASQYEATDLQATADSASLVLSGHGTPDGLSHGYYAKLTKINAADGTRLWTQEYTAGGTPTLIYNECWGAVAMTNGDFVLACGTGIEDCSENLSAQDFADCNQGLGDQRTGALPRGAGVWQSLVIRVDTSGTLLWQRVDSFRASSAPALASSSTNDRTSSAAEWAVETLDRGLAVVTDEQGGIGLLKLAAPTPPTVAPTTAPTFILSGEMRISTSDPDNFIADSDVETCLRNALQYHAGGNLELANLTLVLTSPALVGSGSGIVTSFYTFDSSASELLRAATTLHRTTSAIFTAELAGQLQLLNIANFSGVTVLSNVITFFAYKTFGLMGGSTTLTITNPVGFLERHEAASARWNAWQPKRCAAGSRWRCACPQPVATVSAAIGGPFVKAIDFGHTGIGSGCSGVPPAPPKLGAVLLARRGGCSFQAKINIAETMGYCGLVVVGNRAGTPHPHYGIHELPMMTVAPSGDDAAVNIPAWFVSRSSGTLLLDAMSRGTVFVQTTDVAGRQALGAGQVDDSGVLVDLQSE